MKYMTPTRIVAQSGVVENEGVLLQERRLQIGLKEKNNARIVGKSWIILDFGKEISGGARILTYGVKGNKYVRLRFGESVAETCAELGFKGVDGLEADTLQEAAEQLLGKINDLQDSKVGMIALATSS